MVPSPPLISYPHSVHMTMHACRLEVFSFFDFCDHIVFWFHLSLPSSILLLLYSLVFWFLILRPIIMCLVFLSSVFSILRLCHTYTLVTSLTNYMPRNFTLWPQLIALFYSLYRCPSNICDCVFCRYLNLLSFSLKLFSLHFFIFVNGTTLCTSPT